MQIDWITVAAQIVNFLVLVWLLQRFLYGPVTRAMTRREEGIEARLNQAEEKRREAEREADSFRKKQEEVEQRRRQTIEEAQQEAKELRAKLERDARAETEQKRRAWCERVAEERDEFLRDLRMRTARHIHELARSVLAELADANVEAQAASRFAEHLGNLGAEQATRIVEAARAEGHTVLVESSLELPRAAKKKIENAVHETISEDLAVKYGCSDEILFGIRLMAGGQTVEWSLARYLEQLESAVETRLAQMQTNARKAA